MLRPSAKCVPLSPRKSDAFLVNPIGLSLYRSIIHMGLFNALGFTCHVLIHLFRYAPAC